MDPQLLNAVKNGIIFYILLVCSVGIHEWAHAFVADKLGDPLPRSMGRVTLNPLAHMDLIGTCILPLIMIFWPVFAGAGTRLAISGWGKPVMISLPNPKTIVRDDLLITAAGPLSNLAICFVCAVVGGILGKGMPGLATVLQWAIILNVVLFLFNLLPIPPLDGSHFLKRAIGMHDETYANFSRWGLVILLVLINVQAFRQVFGGLVQSLASKFGYLMQVITASI